MQTVYDMAVPFRVAAKNLQLHLQGKNLLHPNAITSLERRYLASTIDEIDADHELSQLVLDAAIRSQVSSISRHTWMSQMHIRGYELANRPRTLDTQVGPVIDGEPTLAIKLPGIEKVTWSTLVRNKLEKFLMESATRDPFVGHGPIFTHEVRTPRPDHDQGLTY